MIEVKGILIMIINNVIVIAKVENCINS